MLSNFNPNRVIYIFRILLSEKRAALNAEKASLLTLADASASEGAGSQKRLNEIDKVLGEIDTAFDTINRGAYRHYAGWNVRPLIS